MKYNYSLVCAILLSILVAACLSAAPMAMAEQTVEITLEGEVYRAVVFPNPLPLGTASYRAYFEELWGLSPDLGRCLNALAPSLGDGVLALLATLETPPQDAQVKVGTSGVSILPDRAGRGFDRYRLGAGLADCLDGKPSTSLSLAPTTAQVTRADLASQTATIGRFVTYYDPAAKERAANLQLACKALNSLVLPAGEKLSFNATVGPRTPERGFLPAPVIIDGDYTPGVGGGVCQVSTTLYNAALRAGLEIEDSHPHSLRAHYVGAGWDAMVSGWSDLILVNSTPYPVYIFAEAKGGELSVKLLGRKVGRVKLWSEEIARTPYPNEDEEGNTLAATEGLTLVKGGEDGVKVVTYRSIDGVVQRLRTSTYPPTPAVWSKPTE